MFYEKCKEILLEEYGLVQTAATVQEKIRAAVMSREWADFESLSSDMNAVEGKLAGVENKRETLFAEFEASLGRYPLNTKDAKGRFYAMVSLLPENQRNDLTEVYRGLKLETLKLRMANDAFAAYLGGINATLAEFFSLAFPDCGGKIYTPKGKRLSHDMRSMVLNQRF
ncbi:MAG: hypothetical protein LBU82_08095 [Treponema sp.]|jgi:uncharacterized protein YhaN|nr:hypothetical protein [Treponema sp.]